jgi:hypothetical protein
MSVKYTISCTNWENGVKSEDPILAKPTGFVSDNLPKYYVKNPKLIKEVNSLEQLTFKIYPSHPNYSKLKIKESIIKVCQDDKIIFKGKIVKEKLNFDKSKDITCEGLLGTLADNRFNDIRYIKGIIDNGYIVATQVFNCLLGPTEQIVHHGWFEEVVINYNNLFCKTIDRLKIGEICPTVPKNSPLETSLNYSFNFMQTVGGLPIDIAKIVIEKIKDKTLLEILNFLIENAVYMKDDGSHPYPLKYFFPTYDENNTYLNICTEYDLKNQENSQEIVFGENMIDLVIEQDSSSVVTAIVPVGTVSVTDSEGKESQEEVELTYWAPGSKQYENSEDIYLSRKFMYSKSGVDKYGWVLGDLEASTFDMGWTQGAEKDQKNLQKLAANYLNRQGNRIKETVTVNAVDLSFASGYIAEAFEFLKRVTIRAPKHLGENKTLHYLITKVELNLLEPEKNKITFNQTRDIITGS